MVVLDVSAVVMDAVAGDEGVVYQAGTVGDAAANVAEGGPASRIVGIVMDVAIDQVNGGLSSRDAYTVRQVEIADLKPFDSHMIAARDVDPAVW